MAFLTSLKSLFADLVDAFRPRNEYERMEAYLSDATDIHELEARQRAWDQRSAFGSRETSHRR